MVWTAETVLCLHHHDDSLPQASTCRCIKDFGQVVDYAYEGVFVGVCIYIYMPIICRSVAV